MNIEQLERRLWWWQAPHPDWTPESDKDGQGWQEAVSSYAIVADDELVLFDPLVDEWDALDEDVRHHGPPSILITIYFHVRSAQEILDRYDGATLWAHEPAAASVGERVRVTNTFAQGDRLPGGVEPLAMHHMDEAAFWLPSHKAAVVGDTILGRDGAARLCPPSWLRSGESYDEVRRSVQRVLNLPATRLLLTHGGPVEPSALEV